MRINVSRMLNHQQEPQVKSWEAFFFEELMESWLCKDLRIRGRATTCTARRRSRHSHSHSQSMPVLPAKRGSVQPCQLHSSRWHALCTPALPTNKRCHPYTAPSAALPAWWDLKCVKTRLTNPLGGHTALAMNWTASRSLWRSRHRLTRATAQTLAVNEAGAEAVLTGLTSLQTARGQRDRINDCTMLWKYKALNNP